MTFRRWSAAERVLDAIRAEVGAVEADDWREEIVDEALEARAHDVVERQLAELPADRHDRRLQILTECMRRPADLIDRLNAHACAALAEPTMETAISLAFAMLDSFPALGIFIARGALTKARSDDSYTLLTVMEEARDELGLDPFEPWWDIWESIIELPELRGGDAATERAVEVERITGELRREREKADEASEEIARLRRRLKELESESAGAASPPTGSSRTERKPETTTEPRSAVSTVEGLAGEKSRLRAKIEDLQRIISQGQMERRELRQRLATAAERTAPEPTPATAPAPVAVAAQPAEDDSTSDDGESVDRPRRVLVPVFGPRAAKAVADLSPEVAELVFVLVGELAAGRENAWLGVKRLRVRQVLSARAGIHYRVLFTVGEGTLDVVHVTHRKDLEVAIASLERA